VFTRRQLLAASPAFAQTRAPLSVLAVTGGHDHEHTFYTLFDGRPDWRVTVDPHPAPFNRDVRSRYDAVVFYDMIQGLAENRRGHLRDFVEAGKGIVILHHAICSHADWPWWHEEVAGALYLPAKHAKGPASSFQHDIDLTVEPTKPHSWTAGIGKFTIHDETYKGMWYSSRIQTVMKTAHPTADGPVAWIGPHEKARTAVIQLGHDHFAHQNPAYRTLVHRAIDWSSGRL
jgi:type 1 glutamine amidotransferase